MNYAVEEIEKLGLTKQRQAVLRVIRESEMHLTANEVFEGAKGLLPGISFATVYNSLKYLKTEGLIGEIQYGPAANRFDRNLSKHDHAICNKCGKIVDMELDVPVELMDTAADISSFKAESIELTLRGLCSDCEQ